MTTAFVCVALIDYPELFTKSSAWIFIKHGIDLCASKKKDCIDKMAGLCLEAGPKLQGGLL